MWYRYSLASLVMASGLLEQGMARAQAPDEAPTQGGFYFTPSLSLYEVYDDNLFFAFSDEVSDYITRVSPALEVGYESEKLSCSVDGTIDAEWYHDNSDLNSSNVRSFANMDVEYLPTSRLTLKLNGQYTETDTAVDLSLVPGGTVPGLTLGRAEAQRKLIHPSASYQFTSNVAGSLEYEHTSDSFADTSDSDTDIYEIYVDQKTSALTTVSYGYLFRQYSFVSWFTDAPAITETAESHTPWIGLSHRLNRQTRVAGRVGPRFENESDSADPYVLISAHYEYGNGDFSLNYERDETTLLGESGRQEYESVYAAFTHRFGSKLQIEISPGYASVSPDDDSADDSDLDIYHVGVAAHYTINRAVRLTASYDLNSQKVNSDAADSGRVTRNVVLLGVTLLYP